MEYRCKETILNLSTRTLVVAAHPDDEVLGCGGTMARIAFEGGEVQTIFLTDGESSRYFAEDIESRELSLRIQSRIKAADAAAKILGSLPPKFLNFPDNQLDSIPLLEIVRLIETEISRFQPSRVITHHVGDLNIDHQLTYEAVLVATRPQGGCPVKELLSFEIPSATEWRPAGNGPSFSPNLFVNIDTFEKQKLAALNSYKSEMKEFPHPRSIDAISALMRWRGATSMLDFAEAFILNRGIY
jgi:LmbE family N-acetylglucosaminyl deacetylase